MTDTMKPIIGYLKQADISSFGVNFIGQEHSMDALCSGGMRMIECWECSQNVVGKAKRIAVFKAFFVELQKNASL